MRISFAILILMLIVKTPVTSQEILTDTRDGNSYKTVTIEGATWMSENLRYAGLPKTFYFDYDENNAASSGALYEWETALKACPAGWHLPSGDEFRKLIDYFSYDDTWVKGSNKSFHIQLGGYQDYQGVFFERGESAYYWTSIEYDESYAEYFSYLIIEGKKVIDISRKEDIADLHGSEKINRYSVRCIKNN